MGAGFPPEGERRVQLLPRCAPVCELGYRKQCGQEGAPIPATRLRCCRTCGIIYIPRGSWEGRQDRSLRSTPFPPLGKSRKCSAHGLGDRRLPYRLSPWTALHLLQAENQGNLGGCPQLPAHLPVCFHRLHLLSSRGGPATHVQPLGTGPRLISPALKTLL